LQNITSEKSRYGVLITGLPESENVYDIHVEDCSFNGVLKGNEVFGARDVHYRNLMINGSEAN